MPIDDKIRDEDNAGCGRLGHQIPQPERIAEQAKQRDIGDKSDQRDRDVSWEEDLVSAGNSKHPGVLNKIVDAERDNEADARGDQGVGVEELDEGGENQEVDGKREASANKIFGEFNRNSMSESSFHWQLSEERGRSGPGPNTRERVSGTLPASETAANS